LVGIHRIRSVGVVLIVITPPPPRKVDVFLTKTESGRSVFS